MCHILFEWAIRDIIISQISTINLNVYFENAARRGQLLIVIERNKIVFS